MDKIIKDYPHKDDRGQDRYVKYPVCDGGKWKGVDVVEGGYTVPLFATAFDTEAECQKACDIENKFWGYTPEDVEKIISWSMNNTKTEE